MARLGIIACQVLERELAYLINDNKDIDIIYLKKTPENRSFSKLINKNVEMINEPGFLKVNTKKNELLIEIITAGLHTDIDELAYKCEDVIESMMYVTNGILFFYGLCGNALKNIFKREDLRAFKIEDEGIVDDCIVASLGRERYMGELRNCGTFFLTRGWIDYWDVINRNLEKSTDQRDVLFNLVKINGYKEVLYIMQDKTDNEANRKCAREIANSLELGYKDTLGTLDILEKAFNNATREVFFKHGA